MVRLLLVISVLFVSGCTLTLPSNERPELKLPEEAVLELEMIEALDYKSFEFPKEIESIIKNAPEVVKRTNENGEIYVPVDVDGTNEEIFLMLTVEQAFKIRDLYVAARENKKLADDLIRVNELSVEERNQLVRIAKAEAYRMKRVKAFNEYYREEVKRVEQSAQIEIWSTRIIAVLALVLGL